MQPIDNVIQGNEQTLFNRVFMALQRAGCSKGILWEFEKHCCDDIDSLIDVSYTYLGQVGYY